MMLLQLPGVNRLMERFGLLCRWRAGMTLELSRLVERPDPLPGYEIVTWDGSRLSEVARVDYLAYRESLDARLYWQYFSTPLGCEAMWREAISGKFGRFDPERTLLLLRNGVVCGDIMASMRSHREGFIGNLAVAPEHRHGNGSALLLTCLWKYREAGYDRVSLAVTLENQRALRLYRRLGFEINGKFPLVTRAHPNGSRREDTGPVAEWQHPNGPSTPSSR